MCTSWECKCKVQCWCALGEYWIQLKNWRHLSVPVIGSQEQPTILLQSMPWSKYKQPFRVLSLLHHIESATPNSDDESTVLERYSIKLSELWSCLRLVSMSYTWIQIAWMLGVSHMTITDDNVQRTSIHGTMVWGQLRSMGFSVTRESKASYSSHWSFIHCSSLESSPG